MIGKRGPGLVLRGGEIWPTLSFLSLRLLLDSGANRSILTDEGERPVDLVDPGDQRTIAVMLGSLEKKRFR